MKIEYRPRALADIDDIARYLETRSAGGARNVLQAIHDSIQSIAEQPYGSIRTSDPDIRMKVEPRYRYKISTESSAQTLSRSPIDEPATLDLTSARCGPRP